MTFPTQRRERSALAWPALLATVLLLILLLAAYTLVETRRLQRNLSRELEDRGVALIGVLEASSRNAIASTALVEEMAAQRLLDNARFIDFIVGRSPRAQELVQRIVSENKLAKVELLDRTGQPLPSPPAEAQAPAPPVGGRGPFGPAQRQAQGMMPMMRGMTRPREGEESLPPGARPGPGMPFMWGQRWGGSRGDPALLFPALPKNAKIRRFWEGSAFGVAVPAQSFDGVIAVHADAEYLLKFRREVGVQRLIEDLGRETGVAGVTLLDRDLTVLASSDPAAVGRREENGFLRGSLQAGTVRSRRTALPGGLEVYEIVKPFALEKNQPGLLRLDLGMEGLTGVARQAERGILFYSLGLLLVGIGGAVAIFWLQARHAAERRALEAAMAREQRLAAVGTLAAGVAHEIRNPLNAISIGLQRLRKEFPPVEAGPRAEYTRFTQIMQAQIGRLNDIVNRFLTLARPVRLSLTEEPLAPVLKELLTLLSSQASAQQVRIVEDLALDATRVRMDRPQLTQAFMNVLLNAMQAMPTGGTLIVRAAVATGEAGDAPAGESVARIVISDTGPGIPAENLDRVFEPYFTTKEDGTGLGLAMTHKILQDHHGGIRAESKAGGGATFVITLPLAPAAP
ncbi:MAG TPA: ATP-binding protein [Candidatus Methylomirabilis sp.]|nr:ATP-binding protein [Candidatus Methylomirabilis sp.]